MRPIANFALHAFAAAMLTAFATGAGAAQYLALGDSIPAGSGSGRIEVESFHWGTTQAKGNVEFEWKVEEGESAPPPPRPSNVTLKRGTTAAAGDPDRPIIAGSVPNASAAPVGSNETLTVGGGRTESGQATGKRQHKPLRMRSYTDTSASAAPAEKRQHGWNTVSKPLDRGSVRVKVKFPWVGCVVGTRYPSIELGDGAKRYVLQDVTVASCGGSRAADDRPTEEVAFYYNKVTVRGWDPKKKQE